MALLDSIIKRKEYFMGTTFSRAINEKTVENLLNDKLWNEKLKNDCLAGEVFMALRDNYISFYHEGGNLFNYTNKFETHIKHVALLDVKKSAYKEYADTVNVIFDNELLPATDLVVDKQLGLLIFDFSDDVKESRLAKHVINNERYIKANIPVCLQDDITSLTTDVLWENSHDT